MGMSFINWVGFVMLLLALLLNEAFLGINAWYDLHIGAILAGVVWLVVAAALSMWPNPRDKNA
ncbi:MAG: hypothetical protein CV088_16665 [Nitrospira sp. LK70]|nr:hypothetical protein [Nitrospira sp. LK70]